jgi:glycosyltransferase involved in cell wall biosynthesis
MHNHGGIAAIAWSSSQRHVGDYAKRLNASAYYIHYLLPQKPILAPIRYTLQCLKTWLVLLRQHPSAVYVFISPVFAALSVFIYCWFARIPFIMDVGGHAIISRKWEWSMPILRFLANKARVNIVDQENFRHLFESWGAKTLLLERPPLGHMDHRDTMRDKENFEITLISSFEYDEPIELVLGAAEQMPEISFFILGDTRLVTRNLLAKAPRNVTFTGYLMGDDYWDRLDSSQAVMVLTTASNSLLSGAVEGMALGKPLVLSNQPTLTAYFVKGAVFVEHSVESVIDGVLTARKRRFDLARQIVELATEKRERWNREFEKIWTLIEVEH